MDFYVSVPLSRFDGMIDDVSGLGFHPEIRMTKADYLARLDGGDFERMRKRIERDSLKVFTHGPFFGLDIASLDRCLSEYSADCLLIGLEATSRLGGSLMVMHTGYMPQFSRGGRRHWFRNWAERMPRVVGRARELGVAIALENTWDDRPDVLLHLADLAGDGDIRFCLDTGHVNVFSRLSVQSWWDALGGRIEALHLHDNDGLSDDHLEPGKGTFDFPSLARLLKGSGRRPLLDLEVDLSAAEHGRLYIESLLKG
ncbi:MAG TPA: sugar phosphate isomerase/epimerase [Candidatus Eisenbacteria bacterium]|uniref:Sugar phosphate isomerase/epimerase n=1 Tax=Eiseniibacteriota bacterium TaxID=2212470 RepID=A0A7V2AVB9_UNCEI|nr:sugar phosphate isomerase/epimerase [Candidatus Eisenbacteria bacterium]